MFYFHPYLGKIPILTNIFQRGWFNHQLVMIPIDQASFFVGKSLMRFPLSSAEDGFSASNIISPNTDGTVCKYPPPEKN